MAQISYANTAVDTAPVAFTYDDDFLRLTSMTDRLGVTHYSYFPITPVPTLGAGLLAGLTGPIQHDRATFGYDELGRCVSRVVNGDTSSETFDAGGRRTSVANSLGTFATTYEGASLRQSSSSHPNGLAVSFSYADNLADRTLTAITSTFEDAPISQFTYAREVAAAGRILSWSQRQDSQPPSVQTLNYDAADQLTGVSISAAGAVPSSQAYRYDPAGNRVEEQVDASVRPFAYNALNQLAAVESGPEAAVTYQWDAEQRLASVDADGVTTELTYDGLGRCVGIQRTEAAL